MTVENIKEICDSFRQFPRLQVICGFKETIQSTGLASDFTEVSNQADP
jgi:hypothetical protein